MSPSDDALTYTLISVPGSVWECDDCGVLVVRTSLHDAFHARSKALEMVARPGALCLCGWSPVPGVIGGETLAEHQRFCPKAPPPLVPDVEPWHGKAGQ